MTRRFKTAWVVALSVALVAIASYVQADPPFGPAYRTLQASSVVVPNTHDLNFVSGCTVTQNGGVANVTCPSGSGTVTSVACGSTMTCSPSPIVGAGTVSLNLSSANVWLASVGINPGGTSVVPLTITGVASKDGIDYTGTAPASVAGAGTAAGTAISVTGATGGATTGSGTTAGAGEGLVFTTGVGGSGAGGTNANGGAGGTVLVTVHEGGAKSGGGAVGANGTLTARAGAAAYGNVFQVQSSTPSTVFAVTDTGAVTAATIGPSSANQDTLPAVNGDTFALIAATQNLSNKTFTSAPLFTDTTVAIGNATHRASRIFLQGASAVAGDFAPSAGWGNAATVGSVSGSDDHASFTITSAGTGQSQTLSVVYTFHDGTWTNAPYCLSKFQSTNDVGYQQSGGVAFYTVESVSATALTITLNANVNPTATKTYTFSFICLGA